MTYARWRQDGFDAGFVAAELANKVSPLPDGGVVYSDDAFFGDHIVALENGVEFLQPISDSVRVTVPR